MRFLTGIFLFLLLLPLATIAHAQPGKDKKKSKKGDTADTLSKEEYTKVQRLFLEAEKAKVIEDWDEAILKYKMLAEALPKESNTHFQLAQIYYNTNNLPAALAEIKTAIDLDENNKWYWEFLASLYMASGQGKEAADAFKTLITKFPTNPEYFLNYGFLLSKTGQYEGAIKVYDQFEKNFGLDETVVTEKKNLYLRLNKFNEAVKEVEKLIDAYPGEVSYLFMLADLYRANRMREKATEVYKQILKTDPENSNALLALAGLGYQTGNGQQSEESIRKIFENPNADIDTKIKILYPYIQFWETQKQNRQTAFDLAEILTRTHPDEAKAFAIRGDLYYLDNQDDNALTNYLRALELNKDVFQVWQQVLSIYSTKRDWQKLQSTATEAAELFPNQAIIYLFKGTAEMQNNDLEKSLKSFSKGEKMSADNNKLRAQFLSNAGDVYHSLNQHTASDSAYEKSLKLDPENAYVLNNYSYYLSERKVKLEQAKQMSAYANKLEPDNDSFLDTYAWILFQMNDFTGAKEWQEKAMKAGGDKSGTILEHYGDILFKLGKKEEAVTYWKKALELDTDSKTIQKKITEQNYVE